MDEPAVSLHFFRYFDSFLYPIRNKSTSLSREKLFIVGSIYHLKSIFGNKMISLEVEIYYLIFILFYNFRQKVSWTSFNLSIILYCMQITILHSEKFIIRTICFESFNNIYQLVNDCYLFHKKRVCFFLKKDPN